MQPARDKMRTSQASAPSQAPPPSRSSGRRRGASRRLPPRCWPRRPLHTWPLRSRRRLSLPGWSTSTVARSMQRCRPPSTPPPRPTRQHKTRCSAARASCTPRRVASRRPASSPLQPAARTSPRATRCSPPPLCRPHRLSWAPTPSPPPSVHATSQPSPPAGLLLPTTSHRPSSHRACTLNLRGARRQRPQLRPRSLPVGRP